jgi:hypothetical protein
MNKQTKKSQGVWLTNNEEEQRVQDILDEEFDTLSF